jgi:acyl-coenzyme A synthetase/AMP-(fatty) acid ligase
LRILAGEALPAAYLNRWKARFDFDILDGIGSTRMVHIFISNREGEVPPAAPVKSSPVMKPASSTRRSGTFRREKWERCWSKAIVLLPITGINEKTRQTMLGDWLNTGDKYYQDEEGFLYCAGRTDDMLKVEGIGFLRPRWRPASSDIRPS